MSKNTATLSVRERRLLGLTVALVGSVIVLGIGYKGYDYLRILNRQIANSEQELLNLHEQTLQSRSVDAAFQQVVSEHSTGQSKEEIHDSLRREIYRLALKDPDTPESEQEKSESSKYLVQIPTLREGVLREEGEGYREYQIRFRIPSCTLETGLEFLKRLEQSNQLLRIDTFELSRPHLTSDISLTIEVTRTVLSEFEIPVPGTEDEGWVTGSLESTPGNGRTVL